MSDGLDCEYTLPTDAAALRQFDLRPLPERFDAWCSALERRIEALEEDNATLRERLQGLEIAEVHP